MQRPLQSDLVTDSVNKPAKDASTEALNQLKNKVDTKTPEGKSTLSSEAIWMTLFNGAFKGLDPNVKAPIIPAEEKSQQILYEDKMEVEEPLVSKKATKGTKRKAASNENQPAKKEKLETSSIEKVTSEDYMRFLSAILAFKQPTKGRTKKVSDFQFLQNYFEGPQRKFLWPLNNQDIRIIASETNKHLFEIIIHSAADEKTILKMIVEKNKLFITYVSLHEPWNKEDIFQLASLFNFVLKLNVSYKTTAKKYEDKRLTEKNVEAPINWFDNKQEVIELSNNYRDRKMVIPHFFVFHTQEIMNENALWIPGPKGHENLSLKVCFSSFSLSDSTYHPWTFAHDELLKRHGYKNYESTYQYIRVQVFEELGKKSKEQDPILDFWFHPDKTFGELKMVKSGEVLNGTKAMKVYTKLGDRLLSVKKDLTNDSSRTKNTNDRAKGVIVLRVHAIFRGGDNFYEKFGYKVISFNNVKAGWKEKDSKGKETDVYISQNVDDFEFAKQHAPKISVFDLYEHFITEEAIKYPEEEEDILTKISRIEILRDLCEKYYGITDLKNCDKNIPTLGALSEKIYDAWIKEKSPEEKAVLEDDMIKSYYLTILPLRYFKIEQPPLAEIPKPTFSQLLKPIVTTQIRERTRENNKPNEELTKETKQMRHR